MNKRKTTQALQAKFKDRMLGYCSVCGTEIIDLTKQRRARFKDNYREHTVELSNKTIMRVGVCDKCKAKLTSGEAVQKTADRMIENHKVFWDHHKAPRGYDKFKVVNPNTTPKDFRRKKEKMINEEILNKQLTQNYVGE